MKFNQCSLTGILCALFLSACGGGGSGGGSGGSTSVGPPPPSLPNAAVGGIWQGRDPFSGSDVVGVVAEDGRAQFVVFDARPFTQYWGTLSTSGNAIVNSTFQVADSDTYFGSAVISGTITARQGMQITVAFTPAPGCPVTTCGAARTASGSLTFNTLYNRGGALSRVAGNWRDIDTGQIYSINSSGVIFQQDATTGCLINGQVSTINTSFNAYAATYTYTGCRLPFAALNGTLATGLIAVDDVSLPNRIALGAQYRAGGITYALYGEATK
jgi:hypothetical protein